MSRKPRIISPTGIYHIILRSVNQHIIFEEDADYRKFLYILADCREFYDIDMYAYEYTLYIYLQHYTHAFKDIAYIFSYVYVHIY